MSFFLGSLPLLEELGYLPGIATQTDVVPVDAILFIETWILPDVSDIGQLLRSGGRTSVASLGGGL